VIGLLFHAVNVGVKINMNSFSLYSRALNTAGAGIPPGTVWRRLWQHWMEENTVSS
jgi:hypothetical protein